MTAATVTELDLLRGRVSGAIGGRLPGHLQRAGWSSAQLAAFQRGRLRELLARAIECSPFHAARLRDVDPARFELADLARLPVMTKAEMMENFEDARRQAGLPGPQVSLRRVEALDRDPLTGKARRFVPLRPAG